MRISAVITYFVWIVLLVFLCLMLTSVITPRQLYSTYNRFSSGVLGHSAEADHTMSAAASIVRGDGQTGVGQLEAKIIFTDAEGAQIGYDLHYPKDYGPLPDGQGPLWLANWRPDIPNNPQVSPVIGNSCLQTTAGDNLSPNMRYRTGYREYIVCRVLDEEGSDSTHHYDITHAKPAVIGVIWASKNHQPMDAPRERCVAEIRIWSTEVAQPGDRFMACVFVIDEEPEQVEIYAFELTGSRIVEIGGPGESWPRAMVATRNAPRLRQYRLMQEWLIDQQAHAAAVDRAYDHFAANLDHTVPQRVSPFDGVARRNGVINFTFSANHDSEMFRIRDGAVFGSEIQLYQHIRKLVCEDDERAALMAFQENETAYMFDLNRQDGQPMTQHGTFPNLPC